MMMTVCTLGQASVSWLGGHLGSQAPPQSYQDSADADDDDENDYDDGYLSCYK